MSTIRVVLADDHTLLRQALRVALSTQPDIQIVGEAGDGLKAQEVAIQQAADVVLMDVEMPVINGLEATYHLTTTHPEIGVIIVYEHHEDGHVFQALRAGARGYFSKNVSVEALTTAIRIVASGRSVLDPDATGPLILEFRRLSNIGGPVADGIGRLTRGDISMLALVGVGYSNKEIGGRMNLAESTVKNRMSLIFKKINVLDRTQAAIYGIRHGIVPAHEEAA